MTSCDVFLAGSGLYATQIVHDLALVPDGPLRVAVGGRHSETLTDLTYTGNVRSIAAGCEVRFSPVLIDWSSPSTIAETIQSLGPRLVVNAATVQPPLMSLTRDSQWSTFLRETGLTVASPLQALLAARIGQALLLLDDVPPYVNCSFPDVVNQILAAKRLPVTCGVGNIQILAAAFRETLPARTKLQMLAHHRQSATWQEPAADREGQPPRVWIDGREVDDVYDQFRKAELGRIEPHNLVAALVTVPLIVALARGSDHFDHVPGPAGLPGGYPIRIDKGELSLDLPPGLDEDAAVAWNSQFENEHGTQVTKEGRVVYNGSVREALAALDPDLAEGFHVDDLEGAAAAMLQLRSRLDV